MSYSNGYGGGQGYGGSNMGGAYGGGGGGYGGNGYGGRRGGGGGRRDDRRGGGGAGGYNRSGGGDRQPPPESSHTRLRKTVIRFADEDDFEPLIDPPKLARVLRRSWREASHGICDGFRIAITQELHKHPHYVSLLIRLSRRRPTPQDGGDDTDARLGEKRKAENSADEEDVECGQEVLEDLSRTFRGWVEGREWLNVRLCLQFFSLLVPAGLISALSLLEVYRSLLAVLNEVGGGGDRAERVVRAVGEGLMRAGQTLNDLFPEEVEGIISSIESFVHGRRGTRQLLNPFAPILPEGEEIEAYQDSLDHLLSALNALRENGFNPPSCLPRYWPEMQLPEDVVQSEPYDLAAVSMPPEMYELDEDSREAGEGSTGTMAFYAEDVVLSPSTLDGWVMRSLVLDVIHIFEVNRKECARLLLTLRQYFTQGTFKSNSADSTSTATLSLESLIVSTLLGVMLTLPSPPGQLMYYSSVITELCKLSPNTVAPPVGRAVRKIFTLLGSDGLDVEVARRVAEWFSIHLSNFGFQWMWKEWIPELELPAAHPRRAFIRRAVELEIRLAYHDRIMQTLPEAMLADGAGVISADPPEPVWAYEKEEHPLHSEAIELLRLFRSKAPTGDIRALLQPTALSGSDEPISASMRSVAFETLLHLGSRSFSHFLNATERYLDTLRYLTPDPTSRRTLLDGVSSYWRQSSEMRLVTVDKYLQYGVLEGSDVVDWVFEDEPGASGGDEGDGWTDGEKWEMLRMCLDKQAGKVTALRRRVRAVEKADEAARARRAAEKLEMGEGVGEEDVDLEDTRLERSKEASDVQISLDIQISKLEKLFSATTRHFVSDLVPWCFEASSSGQGLKAVLTLLDSGEEGWWGVRARWGWWRESIRRYQRHLAPLSDVISSTVFSQIPTRSGGDAGSVESRAEGMVRGVWTSAMGGEE